MTNNIAPIEFDEMDDRLKDMLRPAVDRLGYFGDFFKYFGQTPDTLINFMKFTKSCKEPLTADLNELLALVVCSKLGGDYERIQHERLSEKLGFDRDWIAALTGHSSDEGVVFTEEQIACRDLAIKVVENSGRDVSNEIERLAALIGPEACLSALWQISRFWMICILLNSFSMELPRPSIFAD